MALTIVGDSLKITINGEEKFYPLIDLDIVYEPHVNVQETQCVSYEPLVLESFMSDFGGVPENELQMSQNSTLKIYLKRVSERSLLILELNYFTAEMCQMVSNFGTTIALIYEQLMIEIQEGLETQPYELKYVYIDESEVDNRNVYIDWDGYDVAVIPILDKDHLTSLDITYDFSIPKKDKVRQIILSMDDLTTLIFNEIYSDNFSEQVYRNSNLANGTDITPIKYQSGRKCFSKVTFTEFNDGVSDASFFIKEVKNYME
jgi:hypothetical protein